MTIREIHGEFFGDGLSNEKRRPHRGGAHKPAMLPLCLLREADQAPMVEIVKSTVSAM
jgi:hypothetical protein